MLEIVAGVAPIVALATCTFALVAFAADRPRLGWCANLVGFGLITWSVLR